MNKPLKTIATAATRREVLVVGATLAGSSLLVGCSLPEVLSAGSKVEPGAFGPFLKFAQDGTVTVVSKHIEFGQGNHAGLAAIAAEELDADWTKVKVEQAPANAKLYGNRLMGGTQGTGGSSAISNSWVMVAVLPNMIEAEQYFSAERLTARSTLAGFSLWPLIL